MLKLIRKRQVLEMTSLSRSTLYELIAANQFPRQVRFGARSVGWRFEAVQKWIESRPIVSAGESEKKGVHDETL